MMNLFTPFFSAEDVRRINDNLDTNVDSNTQLSERSKRILKSVRFSRQDINHAFAQALDKLAEQ